ncbi:hypothetical protein XELAEV_18002376mg [Xenopus laevis]|nr:hypothetical protein XELAEV_18002376mg [Xenopus laevis]
MPVGTSQAPVSHYPAGRSRSVANPFQERHAAAATGRDRRVYPNKPMNPQEEHENISTLIEEDMIMQMYLNSANGEHFIERNRKHLINRVAHLDPILDDLLAKRILTEEQYELVRIRGTAQEKMRQLYHNVRGWGITEKNSFYQSLKENCRPLIRDLESQ